MQGQGLVDLEAAADLRHRDPARARELARPATSSDDPEEATVAHWIVGLAEHELGNPTAAIESFDAAIEQATVARLDGRAATARASKAVSLLGLGRRDEALAAISEALAGATGPEEGFVRFLHGLVLQRNGQLDAAGEVYGHAAPLLERAGDEASLARLTLNQGTLQAYRGDQPGAIRAFGRSEELARRLDLPVLTAMAAHNTGFALGRWGDVPGALQAFERAADAYRELGAPGRLVGVLAADRCEVLLESGLVAEARSAAADALRLLSEVDEVAHRDEALLQAARVDLAAGDHARAAEAAQQAADGFRASGRAPWAALADYVALQAEVGATEHRPTPPARLLARTRRIARALQREGWPVEAAHVHTFLGRMALATGRTGTARAELTRAAEARAAGGPPARVQAWHARALLRLADEDRPGAVRAVRRGLGVVDEYREALGASELRANASARGDDLARLGIRLALEGGRPAEVLRAAERHRAAALHPPSVRPPADALLADRRAELRHVQASLREATLAGDADGDLRRAVADAERAVRERARLAVGRPGPRAGLPSIGDLRQALGDRVLVEHVAAEGQVHAVVVGPGRTRLVALGPLATVDAERSHLLAALRRHLRAALEGDPTRVAAARRAATAAAAQLDALLLAPLALDPSQPVVLVPTGTGHGIAWATLPSLAGRPVTVAPSAALWFRPTGTPRGPTARPPLLVAGPELPGAAREVAAIAERWPRSQVLAAGDATAERVLVAMGQTDLVHLAAHGTFRADSPQFSSLLLDDGALTVYDLEDLDRAPATVVLPACSAARSEVRQGDELLGTTAALLRLGVRTVIAPVMAVADAATTDLSIALHEQLAAGAAPSVALADAVARACASGDPLAASTALSFVCVGADDRVSG